jgi:Condensation domain
VNGAALLSNSGLAPEAPASRSRRSRPLLLLERTMYREGRTPFTSLFPIQVVGKIDESRLRNALVRIQAKHPLLRCVIEEARGAPRFVLLDLPAPIPLRIVERRRDDDWQTVVRQEWITPFAASREPLVRVVWVRGGDINELVLVGHHCICDGHSGINLVRELLRAYDQPEEEPAVYDALGAIEDLAPAALLEDRRFQRRVRWKAGILRLSLFLKRRTTSQPGRRIPAEEIYFHRWNTGCETAQALTESCRSEGATVLAAVSVAFMQAFRDVRGARGLGRTSAMVNARRFLPDLREDAMFGLAPGIALRAKDLPRQQDLSASSFWDRARAVKAALTRRMDRFGAGLYETLAALESLHDSHASLVAYFENIPAIPNLTLSNMGKLDLPGHYRNFKLERVYSPLVMVSPTPANTIVISSFAGDMEFAIISDDQSLPRAQALKIQHRAMEILRICAGLPQTMENA